MKLLNFLAAGVILLSAQFLYAQPQEGGSVNFEYTTGKGTWLPYEHIISEYYKAYPFMVDTGNISRDKMGISASVSYVEDRLLGGFRIGGIRSTAWADGAAPTGGQWNEIIMVKCNYADWYGGIFFIRQKWFRVGLTAGVSLNSVKMKSERSSARFQKAKDGKYVFVNGGDAKNFESRMFGSVKFGLPIAIGRKITISVEPFVSIALWKVNASEMRGELMPNSIPAADKSYYKGFLPYTGVRFAFGIGGLKV